MDSATREILAKNARRLRKERGWSQKELARRSGVAQTSVSNLERPDSKSPTLDTLESVAKALCVPVWSLLVDTNEMPPEEIRKFGGLVSRYPNLPEDGKNEVARVAERESRYANQDVPMASCKNIDPKPL